MNGLEFYKFACEQIKKGNLIYIENEVIMAIGTANGYDYTIMMEDNCFGFTEDEEFPYDYSIRGGCTKNVGSIQFALLTEMDDMLHYFKSCGIVESTKNIYHPFESLTVYMYARGVCEKRPSSVIDVYCVNLGHIHTGKKTITAYDGSVYELNHPSLLIGLCKNESFVKYRPTVSNIASKFKRNLLIDSRPVIAVEFYGDSITFNLPSGSLFYKKEDLFYNNYAFLKEGAIVETNNYQYYAQELRNIKSVFDLPDCKIFKNFNMRMTGLRLHAFLLNIKRLKVSSFKLSVSDEYNVTRTIQSEAFPDVQLAFKSEAAEEHGEILNFQMSGDGLYVKSKNCGYVWVGLTEHVDVALTINDKPLVYIQSCLDIHHLILDHRRKNLEVLFNGEYITDVEQNSATFTIYTEGNPIGKLFAKKGNFDWNIKLIDEYDEIIFDNGVPIVIEDAHSDDDSPRSDEVDLIACLNKHNKFITYCAQLLSFIKNIPSINDLYSVTLTNDTLTFYTDLYSGNVIKGLTFIDKNYSHEVTEATHGNMVLVKVSICEE